MPTISTWSSICAVSEGWATLAVQPMIMHVMAGLMVDDLGRVLLAERPAGKHLAGFWEFPGGKVEPDESRLDALSRELREELGIELQSATPLIRVPWKYRDRTVLLDAWRVDRWLGTPQSMERQALRWCEPQQIDPAIMTPADRPILQALRLPDEYAITPADVRPDQRDEWFERITQAIRRKPCLIQLRLPLWSADGVRQFATDLLPAAREHRSQLLLHADIEGAVALGVGVHLTSAQLSKLSERPLPWQQLVGVSCHDAAQLGRATDITADFATLSQVASADSHDGQCAMDWGSFRSMAEAAALPVFARGGMRPSLAVKSKMHAGQGVAGVESFWARK